jgi:putative flippase GtrA
VTRPRFIVTFFRAQLSSIAASVVDFGVLIFCVEVLHVWYVAATALGAFCGAVTNFLLGRYWSFEAAEKPLRSQVWRYALVALGSLLLNSAGVYLITEKLHLVYWLSKVITALLVGICFNFTLQRSFVFRKVSKP